MFQEAEIVRHAVEHPLVGTLFPQTDTQSQRAGVVIRRVPAFSPRDAIDRVLNETGRVGHPIQVLQRRVIPFGRLLRGFGKLIVRPVEPSMGFCVLAELFDVKRLMNTNYNSPRIEGIGCTVRRDVACCERWYRDRLRSLTEAMRLKRSK